MLERRAFRVSVRVAGWNVIIIENSGFFDERGRRGVRGRQFDEQFRYHVPPRLLARKEMQGFYSLFSRLMCRKAGPLVSTG